MKKTKKDAEPKIVASDWKMSSGIWVPPAVEDKAYKNFSIVGFKPEKKN